jgi:hypothetical protein
MATLWARPGAADAGTTSQTAAATPPLRQSIATAGQLVRESYCRISVAPTPTCYRADGPNGEISSCVV